PRDDGALQEARDQPVLLLPADPDPDAGLLLAVLRAASRGREQDGHRLHEPGADAQLQRRRALRCSAEDDLHAGLGRAELGHHHPARRDHGAHDRLAVLHPAADHVEERLGRDEELADVPPAEDPALHHPLRLHLLGRDLPARAQHLLVHLEPVDHGPAVHRHQEHADPRQRGVAPAPGPSEGQGQADRGGGRRDRSHRGERRCPGPASAADERQARQEEEVGRSGS
ncbi:hypothetical protein CRE_27989, partial [Caenorhabditis remanei]